MSPTEKVVSLLAYGLIFTSCQFSLYVIRKYHNSKPLGMQTLHGKAIVLLTKVLAFLVAFFATIISWRDFVGIFSRTVSASLWFASLTTMLMLTMTFMSVVVTKYLSIYHGSMIANINEEK